MSSNNMFRQIGFKDIWNISSYGCKSIVCGRESYIRHYDNNIFSLHKSDYEYGRRLVEIENTALLFKRKVEHAENNWS